MLKLSVLQTGSSGNSIILDNGQTIIALDMGIKAKVWNERSKAVGYEWKDIEGVLVSHAHSDHVNTSLNKMIAVKGNEIMYTAGFVINDISRKKMLSRFKVDEVRQVEIGVWYKLGTYNFKPIRMVHTGLGPSAISGCIGFDIHDTVNDKRIIYATDTQTLEYVDVPEGGFDLHLIEENHSTKRIKELFEMSAQTTADAAIYKRSTDHLSVGKLAEWMFENNPNDNPHVPLHESAKGKDITTIKLKNKQYYHTYWEEETNE